MKLTFRQGIARYQKDGYGNATFLQRSTDGQFVNLVVSPISTVIIFAQRDATYVVEEAKSVQNAWGPFNDTATKYLYWDVNLLTAELTRGFTLYPPLYSATAPDAPIADQHWFDTVDQIFRVWNGQTWVEKIRCFAGTITSGSLIHPYPIGTQAGLIGDFEGGHIVLDAYGNPLRQRNPNDPPHVNARFVTSVTWLNIVGTSNAHTRLESLLLSGQAAEEMGKFSLIQMRPGRRLVLARSSDHTSRVAGIILEDLNESETGVVVTTGLVKNEQWAWPEAAVNRPLFCGMTGQVTLTPPSYGVVQQIGFVYDVDAIFMDIKQVIILDDPDNIPVAPPPPITTGPIANFTASVSSGTAPLTVDFTSNSPGATYWEWDFENNGFWDATGVSTSYTYSTPGVYTVNHRASNTNGADTETKANFITVLAPVTGSQINLGLSFGAPSNVSGGQTFGFQVITTNDSVLDATNVIRTVKLRTSNGHEVQVINAGGGTVTSSGVGSKSNPKITTITLPAINLAAGGASVTIIQVRAQTNAGSVLLQGTAVATESDSEPDDNTNVLEIQVLP